MQSRPLSVVILISGRGTNMLAIVDAALGGTLPVEIAAVISNRPNAPGLDAARQRGIHCETVTADGHPDRNSYDAALAAAIDAHRPGLVVLAGFMRILTPEFVKAFEGRLLNIHPSLLPAYTGLHTHRRVLEARETTHGCSVHFVTEELDGGPTVLQARVPVHPGDTENSLSARVQHAEHRIYPEAIAWFAEGRLKWQGGDVQLDGQPLRTPVIKEFR